MASPSAILSILVDANTGKAGVALANYQKQLEQANLHGGNLEKQSSKTSKSISGLSAPAEKSARSLAKLAGATLAAGGAFVAFEKAKEAITTTVELGHATERLSAITGLDAKQASTWIETMKVRGVATKAVGLSFITLSRNIRNAGEGSKAAKKAFEELGVSQDDLKKRNTQQVLLEVADGLAKIDNPARRAALAQQLFGRAAQGLIPVLAQGRKGVQDALDTTQKYGAFLPKSVKGINQAVDAQRELALAGDGLKISFTTAVLPSLVAVSQKVLDFIVQMRTGKGAGGDFARAITSAFTTIKTVVTNVIGAVGGLGNAVRIAVGAFVASKIVAFGSALADMFTLIRASPVGAFFTAVGLLAGAFLALSGRQHTAAETAREVHDAWDQARTAANALRDAHLQTTQATLDSIKANEALKTAQEAVTKAADDYGKKSPQYHQAEEDLAQAKIDSKRASNSLSDALHDQTTKQHDSTAANQKAIETSKNQIDADRKRIAPIAALIDTLTREGAAQQHNTTGSNALHDAQRRLSAATQQLATDQQGLNRQINLMPGHKLSDIQVNVDFASNISNAIKLIAKQVGGTFAPLQSKPAFHAVGGLVTQPGYFAGEEAPQHPEVILATNPAYRSRNVGLWAQAGNMLGIPGFAQGGLSSTDASVVQGVPPWASGVAGKWIKPKASSWIQSVVKGMNAAQSAGGPSGAMGPVPSGTVRDWLTKILKPINLNQLLPLFLNHPPSHNLTIHISATLSSHCSQLPLLTLNFIPIPIYFQTYCTFHTLLHLPSLQHIYLPAKLNYNNHFQHSSHLPIHHIIIISHIISNPNLTHTSSSSAGERAATAGARRQRCRPVACACVRQDPRCDVRHGPRGARAAAPL